MLFFTQLPARTADPRLLNDSQQANLRESSDLLPNDWDDLYQAVHVSTPDNSSHEASARNVRNAEEHSVRRRRLYKAVRTGNSSSSNPSGEARLRNDRNEKEHVFNAVDIATYIAGQDEASASP